MTALVIDDDLSARSTLGRLLRERGWHVRSRRRIDFAMELGTKRPPNLVLLDVSLPGYVAEVVASSLRVHFGSRLRTLALGAIPQPDLVRVLDAFGFLQKPIDSDRLDRLLERVPASETGNRGRRAWSRGSGSQIEELRREIQYIDVQLHEYRRLAPPHLGRVRVGVMSTLRRRQRRLLAELARLETH